MVALAAVAAVMVAVVVVVVVSEGRRPESLAERGPGAHKRAAMERQPTLTECQQRESEKERETWSYTED